MRELKLFAVLLLAGILLSCAGSSEKAKYSSGPCPEWFSNVPEDPDYLFGAATAVSRDLQISVNKAKTEGTAEIAKQIELHIEGLTKKFDEEVGLGEDANLYAKFTQATKLVIDQTLRGVKVRYQDTKPEGAGWRACVLMECNLNEINKGVVDGISREREMYIRFRDSQTFKELEEEVEKYRQYKKEQGLP
jgi:hypothetical protein